MKSQQKKRMPQYMLTPSVEINTFDNQQTIEEPVMSNNDSYAKPEMQLMVSGGVSDMNYPTTATDKPAEL